MINIEKLTIESTGNGMDFIGIFDEGQLKDVFLINDIFTEDGAITILKPVRSPILGKSGFNCRDISQSSELFHVTELEKNDSSYLIDLYKTIHTASSKLNNK